MKTKITLLILILSTSICLSQSIDIKNFEITSSTNHAYTSSNRLDYRFDIRGDYGSYEIKLAIYINSESYNNMVSYIRWNREGDYNLNFPTYTTKNMWSSVGLQWRNRSFSIPGNTFILKVTYRGVTEYYTYNAPDQDSDGDGLNDSEDNCPNDAGPVSNNGCPGLPNLTLTKLIIKNGMGQTYTVTNGQIPNIYYGEGTEFQITIKNNGNDIASSSSYQILASAVPNNYPNGQWPIYGVQTGGDNNDLQPGETKTFTITEYFYDYIGSLQLYNGGTYYFYVDIDYNDDVEESNESISDNISQFAWKFIKTSNKNLPVPDLNKEISIHSYSITIYDFSGNKVKTETVSSKEEENILIQNLPKGYYIIKTSEETKKVFND